MVKRDEPRWPRRDDGVENRPAVERDELDNDWEKRPREDDWPAAPTAKARKRDWEHGRRRRLTPEKERQEVSEK